MTDLMLRVRGLGKSYSRRSSAPTSLRATLAGGLRRLLGQPRAPVEDEPELWALRDVSFEVRAGEVVGVIGRNGAGKSTLLKLLSRITSPTTGEFEVYGRLGALLEVGTGFHPELTGRENIFLNAAILGMTRAEVRRKLDDIVAFAELERFLDTPVMHYSSGMYMRLAFAVAAHVEPDVLLLDEVLAVGDASFQRKCLSKMDEVGARGRTVLVVSHDMATITRLCSRVILLDGGRVVLDGPPHQVVQRYLRSDLGTTAVRTWPGPAEAAPGDNVVRLRAVRIRTEDGVVSETIDIRRSVGLEVEFDVLEEGHVLVPNFHVLDGEGRYLFVALDHDPAWRRRPRPVGRFVTTGWVPGNFFAEGTVVVGAAVSTMDPVVVHFFERDAVAFQVIDSCEGDSSRGDYAGPIPGVVRPMLRWTTRTQAAGTEVSAT